MDGSTDRAALFIVLEVWANGRYKGRDLVPWSRELPLSSCIHNDPDMALPYLRYRAVEC